MTLLAVVKGCMGLSIYTGSVSWRRTAYSWSTAMPVSGALTTMYCATSECGDDTIKQNWSLYRLM